MDLDYLKAAARAVSGQAAENPGLGIPADPEVADFMGAAPEEALELDDLTDY